MPRTCTDPMTERHKFILAHDEGLFSMIEFASQALGGLSRLSAWWTGLGIKHDRIEPARPEQHGRHERMPRG